MRTAYVSRFIRLGLLATLWIIQTQLPSATAAETSTLPLSKVVLYSSGVGYFQHDGTIIDRAQLDLRFSAGQINDLLKSLVVQDFSGGKISTVTYSSRDPVAKALGSFGINLTGNPSLGQILIQLRGEQVDVSAPNPIRGTILGIEKKTETILDGQGRHILDQEYLSLVTDGGFRLLPLAQVQQIKLLNPALNAELHQALAVLATNHDSQRKTVSLMFDGTGRRTARVSYLAETPIWKTSYRLVLNNDAAPYLQGWAIVDNTTDQDWHNIRLALVSGRPILFIMDLYQPLYNPRPVVQPELYTHLNPHVHGDTIEESRQPASAPLALQKERALGGKALGMAEGRAGMSAETMVGADIAVEQIDRTASLASAHIKGELFEYQIETPVTLAKHTSALLPIIGQALQGQKLSIYNQIINSKHPMNGYRLTNTSTLHLMQGPITIFDDGTYAGDARIEDLPPGQDRLISYALDLKAEVESHHDGSTQELSSISLKKGTMLVTHRHIDDRTYLVKNRDKKPKTIVIEHPYRAEWKLLEPRDAPERSRDTYRFNMSVEPGKSSTLRIKEVLPVQESILLMDSDMDHILSYHRAKEISPKVKDALQRVVQLRGKLDGTKAQRTRFEQRINEITAEHGRIRENMQRLQPNSDLYTRYVKKLDQQETELEKLRKDIEALKNTEEDQRRELQHYLEGMDVTG